MSEFVEIDEVRLFLAQPDRSPGDWIGQHEIPQTATGLLADGR